MPEKGMLVYIYRNALGDCTNDGISSKYDKFVLIDKTSAGLIPEIFEPQNDIPAIYLFDRGVLGPVIAPLEYENEHFMFGGNFAFTSDSRFRGLFNGSPIPIHDRQEKEWKQ